MTQPTTEQMIEHLNRLQSVYQMEAGEDDEENSIVQAIRDRLRGQEWRDISTAPRDGRPILVNGGQVEWRAGGWFSSYSQRFLTWQPTHWMPLPSAPAPEKRDE